MEPDYYDGQEPERPDHFGTYDRGPHSGAPFAWITAILLIVICAAAISFYATHYKLQLVKTDDESAAESAEEQDDEKSISAASAEILSVDDGKSPEAEPDTEKQAVSKTGDGPVIKISSAPAAHEDEDQESLDSVISLSLPEIYEKVIPSVVSVISEGTSESTGTGIIMSSDGYIITNYHVISGADSISVMLENESEDVYEAYVVGSDSITDLAVLKINATGLTCAEFGDSDQLRVGDSVVAIGDPLGVELRGTMTNGIVSAINRDVTTGGRTLTLIQTNAQLNSGNSGGPLINDLGQVIGINTMKIGSVYSGTVEGIGFAIPIVTAKPIIDELILNGYISGRPAIDVEGESVPLYVQRYYRYPDGVYVSDVADDSYAASSGIRKGDVIVRINDTDVSSVDDMNTVIGQMNVGDTVTVVIYRNGAYYQTTVRLTEQQND